MTKLIITLEIDGADADAESLNLVDNLLDAGFLQDAINQNENGLNLHVKRAVVRPAPKR